MIVGLAILFLYFLFVFICSIGVIRSIRSNDSDLLSYPIPDVTVVISLYNAEASVRGLIDSLKNQTYKNFSCILIDDGSVDSTGRVVSGLISGSPSFRLVNTDHKGKDRAIRELLQGKFDIKISDSLIVVTDADCTMRPGWLASIVEAYGKSGASMLIGPVTIDRSYPLQATEFLSVQGVTIGSAVMGHPLICGGANLAFTTGAYNRVCGFMPSDIGCGGDMYLLEALKRGKEKIVVVEGDEAIVETTGVKTISAFASQRSRWASKGTKYVDKEIISCAVLVFVVQLLLIAALMLCFSQPIFLLLWVVKFIVDLPLLLLTEKRLHLLCMTPYIVPVSIIYPFYVVFIVVKSLIR